MNKFKIVMIVLYLTNMLIAIIGMITGEYSRFVWFCSFCGWLCALMNYND